MKSTSIAIGFLVLSLSASAQATLYTRGTDNLGNQLIYDSDLDITWYDFSNTNTPSQQQFQADWAADLDITFNGTHYTDWRLPEMIDGPHVLGFDGTTTAGWNITSSELGHLFYSELENVGFFDTVGSPTGCSGSPPYCLTNIGDFENLGTDFGYWFGTEYSADPSLGWKFNFQTGVQGDSNKNGDAYGIAVRAGDVMAPIPEPSSAVLFGIGSLIVGSAIRRYAVQAN